MIDSLISPTALWSVTAVELRLMLERLAIQEILPRFQHAHIHTKADGTLLSDADLAVQQALPSLLYALYPAPLLGEEMSAPEQAMHWQKMQTPNAALWIADPIDGTTNFAQGLPWFAVSVALVINGETVLGATVAPALQQSWHASLNGGAFCNDQRLNLPATPHRLQDCLIGVDMTDLPVSLRHQIAGIAPAGITRHPQHQHARWRGWRSLGASTLEWCALASGQIQAYVHGGQMPWDALAGRLLLAEAGGFSDTLDAVLDNALADPALGPTGYAAAAPGIWPLWQRWLGDHAH